MGAVCCRQDALDLDGEVDLSHFTLLRSVGKGAFGKVRVVQHKGTKQLYALKYINKNKCIQMRAVENIISERRILEQVSHALIVNLRYAFQDDENLFMVLDLMLGGDLRFHLDRLNVMPETYVRFYVAQVALGLHHLHQNSVVHRDIKPDNILLDNLGHAHLTDFNIAVQFSETKALTSVAGSMAYMAPEVLQKRGYFSSVDWWSLGVVCYELLFGKRPFRGKTNDALQHAILHEPLVFPENHRVSPEAIDCIKGLLTRDVTRRLGATDKAYRRFLGHAWFKDIQWDLLETKAADPPFTPDSKRANFDPTHELEEILLEDNPLTVRKRNPKRSATHANSSVPSQSVHDVPETSPERQMMEDKFLTFDHTKPEENEWRKNEMEQKRWAQKMNKTSNAEKKQGIYATGYYGQQQKAGGTYKTSVLDYVNQKPASPLSAGDILKLEELARMARAGVGRDRGTDWRPPSGILPSSGGHDKAMDAMQERDNYIIQAGGVPPPARPPPLLSSSHHRPSPLPPQPSIPQPPPLPQPDSQYSQYRRRRSSDDSYLPSSPETSERPLMGTASSSLVSVSSPRTSPSPPPGGPRNPSSSSQASFRHMPPPALPPPTSLPPPVPTALPPLPAQPIPSSVLSPPPRRRRS
ncbi:kinase-like domain-containing protein [Syncephalastrum racemosum]|uniref:Kinase-like domain-containing protein n=1 Tax=Syncephalastrum racemosum TaxID=13706 RepID=A0A1X2HNG2_SYNRA|nr:kinase-like domain-containing protein [Syncephalastrum racemosum]